MKQLLPVLLGFFIMGFCDIVGVATNYARVNFELSDSVAGFIPSMVFLWFLFLAVPTASLMNRTGRKKMVLLGYTLTVVGMFLPLFFDTFGIFLTAFALLGIGNTVLQVSLNPLLSTIVNGKNLSSSLTAGQVIKAVSSFAGPFIMAFAAAGMGNWIWTFPILAGFTILVAAWLVMTPIHEDVNYEESSIRGVFAELGDRNILMCFLAIAAIVGIDTGINTLAPRLLVERGGAALAESGLGSSIYFLCRVTGSFIGMFLLVKMADRKYYLIHIGLGILLLAALVFASGKIALYILFGAIGYSFSTIFSVIYSQTLKMKPEKANEISGLMVTGVFGGAVTPPLMGLLSDVSGSQIPSVVLLLLCAAYLFFCGLSFKK